VLAAFDTSQYVGVALAVGFAAAVQIVAGFGFGLLSVPLMTMAIPTKDAVVASSLLGMLMTTWQAWHGRGQVDRPVAKRMITAAYLGMPAGLVVYSTVDDNALRLLLGVAVLAAVVALFLRYPRRQVGAVFDYSCGFVSGVLNTSLSTNGPPLVFGLQARQLSPDVFRSTISTVFAFSNVLSVALFASFGKVTGDGLRAALIAAPCMLAGQALGYPLRKRVQPEQFRWLVLGLLALAATSAIYFAVA
jgi:uncharacterized protein